MNITLIAAMERSNGIGLHGQLPWKLKGDLIHFKRTTVGKVIVMGATTVLGFKKPLPNRTTIAMSRKTAVVDKFGDQVVLATSLDDALHVAEKLAVDELLVAGGAMIYDQFLPLANKLIITHIHADMRSDTFFPQIGPEWTMVDNQLFTKDADNQYDYSICVYTK